MAVRKPWDIPPIPKRGDSEENITFESVGRALTGWEIFEIELSRLFSSLTGTGDGTIASIRAYGSVLTFRGRAEMIEAAASVHFSLLPDKDFEKAMKDLLTAGARYAARRNEIAHGVVQEIAEQEFALCPPEYATKKTAVDRLRIDGDALLRPRYIYTSKEINEFGERFRNLAPAAAIVTRGVLDHKVLRSQRIALTRRLLRRTDAPSKAKR